MHRKSDNGDQMSTITWQFYDQLSFLKCCTPGLEKESVKADEDSSSTTSENIDDGDDKANSDSDSEETPKRKKPRISFATRKDPFEQELTKSDAFEPDNYQERNYDDQQFFESLLPYVKNIPLMRKLKLRCKIQEMILKELEVLENDIAQQTRLTEVHIEPMAQLNVPEPNLASVKQEPVEQSDQ